MHHTLKLYSRYRGLALKYYIFQAKWTKIPLIGRLVRAVANAYGKNVSGAFLLTFEEAIEIVDTSDGLALGPCDCRTTFKNCDNPINTEIIVGLSRDAFMEERPQEFKQITKEEAKEVLRKCHENGLIHTVVKWQHDFYAICNCCSCCCVPLRLLKKYGIGNALVREANIVQKLKEHQHTHA
jgi:hypothetical protein